MAPPTIVSLSTIPPRFGDLGQTLRSLLDQTEPAAEIRLNIPQSYRRFPDWDGALPDVPKGITISRCDADLGPATKVLPTCAAFAGQDVDIVFCDDDKVYDRDFISRFKRVSREHPGCCIVEAGETFPDIADSARPEERLPRMRRRRKDWRYRLVRILSLTMHKPHQYQVSGYVDQISGYGGVLVKPDWFDGAAFDIPDVMWTVDDPWLSGHLELNGIPIWLNADSLAPRALSSGRRFALLQHVEDGAGRVEADVRVIEYFRDTYGIWKREGPIADDYARMTTSMKELARRARPTQS